jgi:hypothetical protein
MQHTRLHPIQHPMRTTLSRSLVLALAFLALFSSAFLSHAQPVTLLQMTNNTWRYFQSNAAPPNVSGLAWSVMTYNDAAWPSGRGVFGVEPDAVLPFDAPINTPLNLTQPGGAAQTLTYYFRTSFNLAQSPAGMELQFSELLDDGAVVYLNGTEIFRNRVAAGAVTYSTLAANQAAEGLTEYTNIVSSALRQGNNVIAVEVHQSGATSSDIVFGMGLVAQRQEPVAITKQPKGGLVGIGDTLSLSVEASGSTPQYQWFRNGTAIVGANSATYTVLSATTNNAGTYFVRVSNAVSTNNSANAVIEVVPDTFSPVPLTAIVEEGKTNEVLITFDDAILRLFNTNPLFAGTNVLNYQVQRLDAPSTPITIRQAAPGGSQVRLTVDPAWDPTKDYYITINRIMDTSTNMIKPNSQIGVNFRVNTNIMAGAKAWKWTAMFQSNLPPTWTATNYVEDPEIWVDGFAPFYYETDAGNTNACFGPVYNSSGNGSEIGLGYDSYYFRSKFVMPTNLILSETTMRFTYMLDDGALFHLNGREVYRTNMPSGTIVFNTRAVSAYEGTVCRSNNVPYNFILPGTNVIAVQVHQNENLSDDVGFGMKIDASYTIGFDVPALSYRRLAPLAQGGPVRLAVDWPGTGWTLQMSTNPRDTNSWTTATSTGNSYTNTTAGRYFRLKK